MAVFSKKAGLPGRGGEQPRAIRPSKSPGFRSIAVLAATLVALSGCDGRGGRSGGTIAPVLVGPEGARAVTGDLAGGGSSGAGKGTFISGRDFVWIGKHRGDPGGAERHVLDAEKLKSGAGVTEAGGARDAAGNSGWRDITPRKPAQRTTGPELPAGMIISRPGELTVFGRTDRSFLEGRTDPATGRRAFEVPSAGTKPLPGMAAPDPFGIRGQDGAGEGRRETVMQRVAAELARRRLEEDARRGGGATSRDTSGAPAAGGGGAAKGAGGGRGTGAGGQVAAAAGGGDASGRTAFGVGTGGGETGEAGAKGKAGDGGKNGDAGGTGRPAEGGGIGELSGTELAERLRSRDLYARREAIWYAAANARRDAVPLLADELRRNTPLAHHAAQALGWIGDDRAVPALIERLSCEDVRVRACCVHALGFTGSKRAVGPLLRRLEVERNFQVRGMICEALGIIGDGSAVARLAAVLSKEGETTYVRACAALALARLGDRRGDRMLEALCEDPHPGFQALGLTGISCIGGMRAAGILAGALDSPHPEVWTTALAGLAAAGPSEAIPPLRLRLNGPTGAIRRRAALGLGLLGVHEGIGLVHDALRSPENAERALACRVIAMLGRKEDAGLLIARLRDPSPDVRESAAAALVELDAKEAIPALIAAASPKSASIEDAWVWDARAEEAYVRERAVMLAAAHALQSGGQTSLSRFGSRREFEEEILRRQVELLKTYEVIEAVRVGDRVAGAVLKSPDGPEVLYKEGETILGTWKIAAISAPRPGTGSKEAPPSVTLQRHKTRVILTRGGPPEVVESRR
ncbi:MAG: HEAT repeat domain-containing protein [Planctomycetota bacterium]|nr:HEAT repeat domain-containing protein [Planctomycetota bacterium]